MKILLSILLVILVFSGCCSKTQSFKFGCQDKCIPDTIISKEKKYIKQQIQAIPEPPIPEKYETLKIKINGKTYIAFDKTNAGIAAANKISDDAYTKTLRTILYNLQKESKNNPLRKKNGE